MAKAKSSAVPGVCEIAGNRLEGVRLLLCGIEAEATEKLIRMMLRAKRVFVTGKGRSGLIAGCAAMRLMQFGFNAHVPGEATCPRITRGDLMIAISCSGTTMTTLQLARVSKESRAKVVSVTAVADCALTETADHSLVIPVTGPEIRKRYRYALGPHNNTLFEEALLVYFDAVVYSLLEREGIPKRMLGQRHTNLE
ncbi:MAG: SIS domain-containing protein [Candidatus Brocadiia bacterium]|jgi:6-phospho-3-hexuloisomerase|nr:SIS domain-containing protein [Candidatus Brocadiia bacterium]